MRPSQFASSKRGQSLSTHPWWCGGRPSSLLAWGLVWVLAAGLPVNTAWAQEKPSPPKVGKQDEILFLGQKIAPLAGTYIVTKDVNVRAAPETEGGKVASFLEGERVRVVGKAKGNWLAVRHKGKDLGFVYGPVLMPVIDAVIKTPLTGTVSLDSGQCAYRIVFEGESPIEGQLFNSVDYRAMLECRRGGKSFAFEMPLFITEGPYNGGGRSISQIGMDVLELAQEYERVFSTNLLYDAEKGEVRLDGVSMDKYLISGKVPPIPAADVPSALNAAITLAVGAWSPAFWTDLAKALRGAGG